MNFFKGNIPLIAGCICLSLAACSDDETAPADSTAGNTDDVSYIGKAVGNFSADEWYPGGQLGTTLNVSSGCYEDETPATTNAGLTNDFNRGEMFFERNVTIDTPPFNGLGPASVRKSCIDCHPGYGHGKRQPNGPHVSGFGNGYLLVIYHPDDGANSNDGPYISEVTGMPQTQAVSPFLPPVDETKTNIEWKTVTAMESGLPMQFPDGEKYELIYPELSIPQSAFNTSPKPENIEIRLESTIGIIGTGLLDAIEEEDIRQQYASTAAYYKEKGMDVAEYVNPSYWDAAANDFASGAWYTSFGSAGRMADGSPGAERMVKRFTYALTRATLQDGPGANAVWNITNVSRPDRPKLYTTDAWAKAMSENEEVINTILKEGKDEESLLHPYYADGTRARTVFPFVTHVSNPETGAWSFSILHKFFRVEHDAEV